MKTHDDLVEEIQKLKYMILQEVKPLKINNSKMIELYTYIFQCCLEDRDPNKDKTFALFEIHDRMVYEFIEDCHQIIKEKDDTPTLALYQNLFEKFIFFVKNLNIIFQYLNKFFISRLNLVDLHTKCINIFKSTFLDSMNRNCSEIIQLQLESGYELSKDFVNSFCALLKLYRDNSMDNNLLLDAVKIGITKHYETLQQCFLSIENLIMYYDHHTIKIKQLVVTIKYPCLENEIHQIFAKSMCKPEFILLFKKHFETVYQKKDYEKIKFIFTISPTTLQECVFTIMEKVMNQDLSRIFFTLVVYFYEFLQGIRNIISNQIFDDLYTVFTKKINTYARQKKEFIKELVQHIINNQSCYFLLGILENKEEWVQTYGKSIAQKLIKREEFDLKESTQSLKTMKEYVHPSLVFRIETLLHDYRQSLCFSRSYVGPIPTNVLVFTEKTFLTNHLGNLDGLLHHPLLENAKNHLKDAYKSQFSGRHLRLNVWQSSVVLNVFFDNGTSYEFEMSLIQYIIVEKLRDLGGASASNISLELKNVDKNILYAVLHSLTFPPGSQVPILLKTGSKTKIDPEKDMFSFNGGFSSQIHQKRIHSWKLPNITNTKSPQREQTLDTPFILRSLIMKLLKREKRNSHHDIVHHVHNVTRDIPLIHKQLEYLVNQEFLEKISDGEGEIYEYIP